MSRFLDNQTIMQSHEKIPLHSQESEKLKPVFF